MEQAKEDYEHRIRFINSEAAVAAKVQQEKISENELEIAMLRKQYEEKVEVANDMLHKIEAKIKTTSSTTTITDNEAPTGKEKLETVVRAADVSAEEMAASMLKDQGLAGITPDIATAIIKWTLSWMQTKSVNIEQTQATGVPAPVAVAAAAAGLAAPAGDQGSSSSQATASGANGNTPSADTADMDFTDISGSDTETETLAINQEKPFTVVKSKRRKVTKVEKARRAQAKAVANGTKKP